jgi:hypothetical protein
MSTGTLQRLCTRRIHVVGEDLMAVGDQVGCEGLPHVSEPHDADAVTSAF